MDSFMLCSDLLYKGLAFYLLNDHHLVTICSHTVITILLATTFLMWCITLKISHNPKSINIPRENSHYADIFLCTIDLYLSGFFERQLFKPRVVHRQVATVVSGPTQTHRIRIRTPNKVPHISDAANIWKALSYRKSLFSLN